MVWIEWQKAVKSKIPFWTGLGALFMPLAIGLLIFLSRNPAFAQKLGIVSAKANLVAYSATDWSTYLGLIGEILAAGGFFLFVIATSWVFGREFSDGTVKDMLAVPVPRLTIVLSKFTISTIWCIYMAVLIIAMSLITGGIMQLPNGSTDLLTQGIFRNLITAVLSIVVIWPFAFLASAGRGYLLPLGLAVLTLISANVLAVLGLGDVFPWCIPGLFAQNKNLLSGMSYWIVALAGLVGIIITHFWWKFADQK